MLKTPMSCTVAASKKIWFMAINLPEHGQRVVGSSLKRVELRPASSRQILCVSEPKLLHELAQLCQPARAMPMLICQYRRGQKTDITSSPVAD